jgi:hypothetical protein
MTKVNRYRIASAVATASAPGTPAPNSFESALINGKVHIDFRYRFETVDPDGFKNDAYASTLRTRLNYLTGDWHGFTAFAEAANVSILGQYDLRCDWWSPGHRARHPRFVGTVAWRQNEQTCDAGALKLGSLPRMQLFYSYVGRIQVRHPLLGARQVRELHGRRVRHRHHQVLDPAVRSLLA